ASLKGWATPTALRVPPASERALGRGDRILLARIDLGGFAQRPGHGLEGAFGDVVIVVAVEILDVEGDAGVCRKRLEELAEELGVDLADLALRELHPPDEIGPPRDVDGGAGQRSVHRQVG